jgi:hypothetical protein
VREAAFWVSGAAVAFFITAGAFLLLANLGTGPSEKNLPADPGTGKSGPDLELSLEEGTLTTLAPLPGQRFDLTVENVGSEDLSDVSLTVEVSSENTALYDARYYRKKIEKLEAGESTTVPFYLDLSTPQAGLTVPEPPRTIVEVRAATPEGISAAKTAILPL